MRPLLTSRKGSTVATVNSVDVEQAEGALSFYFADKSVRARADIVIFRCLQHDVTDPDLILDRVRAEVLDERQRGLRGVQTQLQHRIAGAVADWSSRHESPRSLAHEYGYWIEILASGVIGNTGYELLKAAIKLAWKRSPPSRRTASKAPPAKDVLTSFVQLAVIEQCRRHDIPAPAVDKLRVTKWLHGDKSSTAYVRSGSPRSPSLEAEIVVPHEGLGHRGAEVTIRRSNPGGGHMYDPSDDSPN